VDYARMKYQLGQYQVMQSTSCTLSYQECNEYILYFL